MQTKRSRRDKYTADERGPASPREPREPRGPDMEDGVWFTLSLGRKQRADPKWLLPMICKAGGVSKRDVGAIRIEETQTRFEIAADKAADFAAQISRPGATESGIAIAPAGDIQGTTRPSRKAGKGAKPDRKPAHRGKAESANRAPARKHKGPKRKG